jgi:hypothetical protein
MNTNFVRIVNCQNNMPPEDHEFVNDSDYGDWKHGYGKGTMKFRRCLKCGTIEYSLFTGDDGKVVDVDAIYRNPLNITEPIIVSGFPECLEDK